MALAEVTSTIGAAVMPRIASISSVGTWSVAVVPWSTTWAPDSASFVPDLRRISRRADQLHLGVVGQALADLGQPVGGAGDEDLDR